MVKKFNGTHFCWYLLFLTSGYEKLFRNFSKKETVLYIIWYMFNLQFVREALFRSEFQINFKNLNDLVLFIFCY